jgi:hypothetical protein
MRFSIDIDSGDAIAGWLAPDNPSVSPRITVVVPGRADVEIDGTVIRRDVVDAGYHVTGVCGFLVTADMVPDLPQLMDIEMREAETRLPIYRRFAPDRDLRKKLFFFDCSVLPQRRLLNRIGSRFSLTYHNTERNGAETTLATIVNPGAQSAFFWGRSHVLRYDEALTDHGFLRAAMLRDPFEELAERLYFLNYLAQEGGDAPADYAHGLRGLLDFASDLPFKDPKGVALAFRAASETQRRELMSPMTRVFGCEVDEPPRHANVTRALQKLAGFDVVGLREKFPMFRDLLAGVLGEDVVEDEVPVGYPAIRTLANTLSGIGMVNDLLAEDLALYAYVTDAIDEGLAASVVAA